jgi:hypothetical protein
VTPLLKGERRLGLSITCCTDPRSHWWQAASRRLKDTPFFGIRALWRNGGRVDGWTGERGR